MQKIPGYQIIRKINQGGMSTVYLAVQLSVGREVALKVMSPALNADPVFSERFQREANIVGQLTHPNIVSIYDIGRHNNLNYIAMDYLPGGSIHERMTSGLSLQETLKIAKEIAGALDHAHRKGYVHRDIKPENILFNEENTAILSDFGVAKTVSSGSQMTNAGTVVGTPHYMSPEQARGKPIDGRSDIYSLGVVFYEMLTGSVPFKAEEAVAIAIKHLTAPIPTLPSQYSLFQPLLNKLLAKEPEDRFQSGREVITALESTQNQLSGKSTVYTTVTDSASIQIWVLLKALLLTTYAALKRLVVDTCVWITRWRWTKKDGIHLREEKAGTLYGQEDNRTTIVSSPLSEAVLVTKKGYSRQFRPLLLAVLLPIIWLAASTWLAQTPPQIQSMFPDSILRYSSLTQTITNNVFEKIGITKNTSSNEEPSLTDSLTTSVMVGTENQPKLEKQELVSSPALLNDQTPAPSSGLTQKQADIEAPEKPAILSIPTQFPLTVKTFPAHATVRIMNIREKYQPKIELSPGTYTLQVSAKGYNTQTKDIVIKQQSRTINITLLKSPVPGSTFYNTLKGGSKGPAMVIIPAGRYLMGDKTSSNTAPVRTVRLTKSFAVSQYEVTFADYEKFAKSSGYPIPKSSGWGRGSRPVINVSWHDAKAYSNWLSKVTGKKYRLLTEAEWEYIARAGTQNDFWWGSGSASGRANCKRGCNSTYTTIFSIKTAPVGSYKANPFRVYDTAGNVAEWVSDCYQDHYLGAPTNGSSVTQKQCSQRAVRGGSIKTGESQLKSYQRDKRSPDYKASHIGFRVAVDLYND